MRPSAWVTIGTLGLVTGKLWIGGELVKSEQFPTGPILYVNEWAPSVMFDSTHFLDGTQVIVTIEVFDTDGVTTRRSMTVPVVNRSALFGRSDFEVTGSPGQKGIPTVAAACAATNIRTLLQITTPGWTASEFYALVPGKTVVYIHTHGSASFIPSPPLPNPDPPSVWLLSDADEGNPQPPGYELYIYPYSPYLLSFMQAAIGDGGLPPFNPTGVAPIHLAFNDACLTGNDNAFAEAYLWPYRNAYGGWTEDQCQLGWSIVKASAATKTCMETFWALMSEGFTAHESRVQIWFAYRDFCDESGFEPNYPSDPRALVHLYGDYYTRLHGVYTGGDDDSPMEDWWRDEI